MRRFGLIGITIITLPLAGQNLFDAVRNNDLQALKAGLRTPAEANGKNARGLPLVMQAAAFGSLEGLRLVINAGADVNAKNSFDATALMWAAGDAAKARLLVEKGADVNAHSKQGRTPLMIAAALDGGAETVRLLLERGADTKAKDYSGATALLDATRNGDAESVRLLIEKGADVNAASQFGDTPLQSAAGDLNLAAVKLLLAKGARVNDANTDSLKVKFGAIQLIKMTPLMFAVPFGSVELVRSLLDAGADVNAKDIRGMTPLMLAVSSETQDQKVIGLLLKAGARVNEKSTAGETALDWALKFGNRETIGLLRAAGASTAAVYKAPERTAPEGAPNVGRSVEKSVALMERASTEFFKQAGCVGCHHQPITATAVGAARSAGYKVDDEFVQGQLAVLKGGFGQLGEGFLQRIDGPANADIQVAMLSAMQSYGYAADAVTDMAIFNIAAQQRANGSWILSGVSRAPMEESTIARTARAAFLLKQYTLPARKAEFEERIARARTWLLESRASTTDDLANRVLGLYWTGAGKAEIRKAASALKAQQRADGGWAQNGNLASDAFATGESLYALREAGAMTTSDTAYTRGVKYLLDTQFANGAWYVRSRAPKFQPYFQSGFPFDHDQWISMTATGWAVAALAPAGNARASSR